MAGPTAEEQLYIELINETRLDPMGNAARYISSYAPLISTDPAIQSALDYFEVNGAALQAAYAALIPVGPLAWNENLGAAAQFHSSAMIAADQQEHQLPGGPDLVARIEAAGYANWSNLGENIYAYSESAIYGHAGFMVDWGFGPDGMQSPAGHRVNIMSASFREIGFDVTAEASPATQVGPQVVTQDLGTRFNAYFVLGVAYSDNDDDRFYSLGEGRGGLTISAGGSFAVSAASGGYSVQVGRGAVSISLSGGGLSSSVTVDTVIAQENLKLDVVDGNTLLSSGSISVTGGPIATLRAIGVRGLSLSAGSGNQTVEGNAGNDVLSGGGGNDTLIGNGGTDTAVYSGNRSHYQISREGQNYRVVDQRTGAADGNDLTVGIERYQFADGIVLAANLAVAVNSAPVAAGDGAKTGKNIPVTIAVLANDSDPDGDILAVTAISDPLHGAATLGSGGQISYVPDDDFIGRDSLTYTVSDGNGGAATATVEIDVNDARFRLLAVDGFVGAAKGAGGIFGANGFQDITVLAGSGQVTLDASFTRGNDIVRLEGNAASYTIERSGSSAIVRQGSTEVTIPLGTTGLALVFDDGVRELVFDLAVGSARIGAQDFGVSAEAIAAPPEAMALAGGADPDAIARLVLAQNGEVSIAGKFSVFGTNGPDALQVLDGSVTLDASFARGGDMLSLPNAASEYQAYLAGSQLILVDADDTVAIPIGTSGMLIAFSDDDRTLRFDPASAKVLLGDQEIEAGSALNAEPLIPPSVLDVLSSNYL
jgi:uncharacterized protein YkwD